MELWKTQLRNILVKNLPNPGFLFSIQIKWLSVQALLFNALSSSGLNFPSLFLIWKSSSRGITWLFRIFLALLICWVILIPVIIFSLHMLRKYEYFDTVDWLMIWLVDHMIIWLVDYIISWCGVMWRCYARLLACGQAARFLTWRSWGDEGN